ncbi:MAG: nuclear transport factor 2 family protein [Sphingorhabdus sp.]
MNLPERLAAVEEIKQLKARYFRCMDTKDWVGLAAVFAPDALFDLRAVNSVRHPVSGKIDPPHADDTALHRGRDAILLMIRSALGTLISVHHGHTPEIEIIGDTAATGIWAMEDVIRSAPEAPPFHMRGYGHYHDTYEHLDTGWAIKTTAITRLLLDMD